MGWNPEDTWKKIKKDPVKEIAKQGAATFVGGPVGSALAAGHTLGGKKEKKAIDNATLGVAGKVDKAAEEVGKFVQDPMGTMIGDSYKVRDVQLDKKPFQTQQALQETSSALAAKNALVQDRKAPTMAAATIDQAPQGEFRAQQMGLANDLAAQARGEGPSLAGMQMQQNTDDAIKTAMAMAASGRGGAAGGRLKGAMDQASAIQQQGARDSAALRIQEQMAARDQLNSVLAGGRGQDLGLATSQAQLTQGANEANLGAALTTQAQKDAMGQFYDQLGYTVQRDGMTDAQKAAAMDLERLLKIEEMRRLAKSEEQKAQAGLISGLGQAGATIFPYV